MPAFRLPRRRLLAAAALLPLPAFAQGARPFQGTTINVACWAAPYSRFLADYIPDFTEATGIRVVYDTPGFAIYNQRADLELSTRGSAFDVLNITFIYTSRWIGAGWFTPLDGYINDPNRTPPDWDFADFNPGTVQPMRDRQGASTRCPGRPTR